MSDNHGYGGLCSGMQNLYVQPRPEHNPNYDNIPPEAASYRNLSRDDEMFEHIEDLITNDTIVIENIVEVNNSHLTKLYNDQKAMKQQQFGQVSEQLLFHGTKKYNVKDICTYNFDWRLVETHKYGMGVSFSTNAKYASCYSDEESYHKVMIVAKVLVANSCKGNSSMTLPPPGYDTTQKDNGIVTVKYYDNEFYPAYKLYYHLDEYSDSIYIYWNDSYTYNFYF